MMTIWFLHEARRGERLASIRYHSKKKKKADETNSKAAYVQLLLDFHFAFAIQRSTLDHAAIHSRS